MALNRVFGRKMIDLDTPVKAEVTIVSLPKQGKLTLEKFPDGGAGYYYRSDIGYLGKETFTLLVKIEGQPPVKIVYFFMIVKGGPDDAQIKQYCGTTKIKFWKISQDTAPDIGASDLAAWQRASNLSALLANASQSLTGFTDLAGTAVGQTTGEGLSAQITLDPTAAGHNWYIDPTPLNNTDDYLPTSNPNLWQAKADTAAAGKMDMLSVLLHEYGHALGLQHSADSGDFMAATLQPGERRLPSAEELQLMSELVAQLKVGDAPNPSLPTAPLGALLLGRLALGRRPEDAVAQGSQALFAAHPTLQGGSLHSLQDWATTGTVTAASGGADGATLTETSTTQTRLNQVFMVGPNDRYLSFTLSNLALDDAANGPDDAFEVGLLNADTGADLMGAIGLSRTDALLNLQAKGTEHAAQGVSHITNADGSRTYLVDLSGIPRPSTGAGQADGSVAVNLSFDLIGFGGFDGFGSSAPNLGSHVTISDVRLLGLPQANDDSASGAEDTVLHIAALANDRNANLAGLAPVVVAAPTHGTVLTHADGTFSYTPDANYFGADSFTYRLSSDTGQSNVATVSLTITPVNDAPVLEDTSATTLEDAPITLDLLAHASDAEGDALTADPMVDRLPNQAAMASAQKEGVGAAHRIGFAALTHYVRAHLSPPRCVSSAVACVASSRARPR